MEQNYFRRALSSAILLFASLVAAAVVRFEMDDEKFDYEIKINH